MSDFSTLVARTGFEKVMRLNLGSGRWIEPESASDEMEAGVIGVEGIGRMLDSPSEIVNGLKTFIEINYDSVNVVPFVAGDDVVGWNVSADGSLLSAWEEAA